MSKFQCPRCGYDLADVPDYGVVRQCPECGASSERGAHERLRLQRLRWQVPLSILAASMVLAAGSAALAMGSGSFEMLGLTALIVAASGVVNWMATATLLVRFGRTNGGRDGVGLTVEAVLLGFLCGMGTFFVSFLSTAVVLKAMGFEHAFDGIQG